MATLIKRNKFWSMVFREGGKQKWIKTGYTNRHDAEKLLATEMTRRRRSIYKDIKEISFRELAEEWLDMHRLDKKANTISSYQYEVKTHLIPFFGSLIVSTIRPDDIEKFKIQVSKKVNPTTTNYNLRLLNSILETGIRLGYLFENPAKLVKRLKQHKKHFQALTKEEVAKLLDSANDQDKALLMTAIMTGLRMGEILAMRWKNLDWENGKYAVKESYSGDVLSHPKTDSSYRAISLPESLLEALKKHKVSQNAYRLKQGGKYEDNGLIFGTEIGTFINPSNLRNRIYYPALKRAGLPKTFRFHDLRATYATLLLTAGAEVKAVQDQLGHRTARTTLEIYAKVNEEAKKRASEKLEDYLFGGKVR